MLVLSNLQFISSLLVIVIELIEAISSYPLLVKYHRWKGLVSFLFTISHWVVFESIKSGSIILLVSFLFDALKRISQASGFFKSGEAQQFGSSILYELYKEHSDTDPSQEDVLPGFENFLLLYSASPLIQMSRQHLPSIVNLDASKCLFGKSSYHEISHGKEKLFVSADLFVIFAPLC